MFSYFVLQKLLHFNPFTALACKVSGLKHARTRLQNSMFFAPITFTFNAVHCDESPFTCQCENEDKGFRVSNFALLLVGFKRHHGSEGVKCYSNHKRHISYTRISNIVWEYYQPAKMINCSKLDAIDPHGI